MATRDDDDDDDRGGMETQGFIKDVGCERSPVAE
jgi:hypothetical protein